MYFLTTDRIGLKKVTELEVTQEYLGWINDQEVTKYLETGFFPTSEKQLLEFVRSTEDNNDLFLAIYDIKKNLHMGNVKLSNINWIHRTAELGIMIGDKQCWGKGYAKETISLITKYAFNKLNINKIHLGVIEENMPAIKAYQDVGFQIEGVLVNHLYNNGKFTNKVLMAIFNN